MKSKNSSKRLMLLISLRVTTSCVRLFLISSTEVLRRSRTNSARRFNLFKKPQVKKASRTGLKESCSQYSRVIRRFWTLLSMPYLSRRPKIKALRIKKSCRKTLSSIIARERTQGRESVKRGCSGFSWTIKSISTFKSHTARSVSQPNRPTNT